MAVENPSHVTAHDAGITPVVFGSELHLADILKNGPVTPEDEALVNMYTPVIDTGISHDHSSYQSTLPGLPPLPFDLNDYPVGETVRDVYVTGQSWHHQTEQDETTLTIDNGVRVSKPGGENNDSPVQRIYDTTVKHDPEGRVIVDRTQVFPIVSFIK